MNTSFVISWCTLMVSLTWNKWSNHHWEKRTSSAHRILKSGVLFVNNLFASFSHSLWPWLLNMDGIPWKNFFLLICFYESSMFSAFSLDFKVLYFRKPLIFFNMTGFWPMTSLWAAITSKRRLSHPNWLHFLNSECIRIPWVEAPKNFPIENFRVLNVLLKESLFREFLCTHTQKKCSGFVLAQCWCHWPST